MPVLTIARAGNGMRQGVLAEELGVEGPSLVRILDQLCLGGLVERRDDPTDKRAKTLHLTAEGQALAAVIERGGPSSPAWPSDQSRNLSPNASGGLTPLSPPNELPEIPVATREQSGLLCFHSR